MLKHNPDPRRQVALVPVKVVGEDLRRLRRSLSLSIQAITPRQRWSCPVAAFVRGNANVASLVMVIIVMANLPTSRPNLYSAGCDIRAATRKRCDDHHIKALFPCANGRLGSQPYLATRVEGTVNSPYLAGADGGAG